VILEPSDEGDTIEETMTNIREAVELYMEPIDELETPNGAMIKELVF
jgi:predicted RNase H-like HicB family nuclease